MRKKLLFYVLLRKIRSLASHTVGWAITSKCYINAFGNPSVVIGSRCKFGRGVSLKATDGGSITLGRRVCLAGGVQVTAQGGHVTFGDDVFVGFGSIIVSKAGIEIGGDTQIAEYVVIRDQDHRTDSRPIRSSGFHSTPIHIGCDVWIGCKASILRGAVLGNRCVIGAHALVKSIIPDDMLAVGIPARAVKQVRN